MVCSKHVDDLKGASPEPVFDQLCRELSKHFGDLTIQKRQSEHLGTLHVQNEDYSVSCNQDHYVKQLRLMSLDPLGADEEEVVTDADRVSSYRSLV